MGARTGSDHAAGSVPGKGQWALGDRTPLNDVEAAKAGASAEDVRDRFLLHGPGTEQAPLSEEDLKIRLRWWGLHLQRPAAGPGGVPDRPAASAGAEDAAQEPFFMLRVRTDGGTLHLAQLQALAEIATRYARGTADLTTRQSVQFHWIRLADMPQIWTRLEQVGLRTVQSGGDGPHAITGSPLAGIDAEEIIDATPAIEEIIRRCVGSPDLFNLPRKFNSTVTGSPHQDIAQQLNDLAFVAVVHPEHGPGFDVWVGGGPPSRAGAAQRLGAWVPLAEVPDVWQAVIHLFRDHGYRRLRSRGRLHGLLADWGPPRLRQVLEQDYLGRALADGPPAQPHRRGDLSGVHRQRDGRYWLGAVPPVGRVAGRTLPGLVAAMQRAGSTRLRITPGQKLIVLDVAEPRVAGLVEDLAALDLPVHASAFRRGAQACTGNEFCRKAIVETKAAAAQLVRELERRFADRPDLFGPDAPPYGLHVDGCPNSCARAQLTDLGLSGVLLRDPRADRAVMEGFQVYLGGGPDHGVARHPRTLRIPSADLAATLERLLRQWLAARADDEPFADWARRADEGDLLAVRSVPPT